MDDGRLARLSYYRDIGLSWNEAGRRENMTGPAAKQALRRAGYADKGHKRVLSIEQAKNLAAGRPDANRWLVPSLDTYKPMTLVEISQQTGIPMQTLYSRTRAGKSGDALLEGNRPRVRPFDTLMKATAQIARLVLLIGAGYSLEEAAGLEGIPLDQAHAILAAFEHELFVGADPETAPRRVATKEPW